MPLLRKKRKKASRPGSTWRRRPNGCQTGSDFAQRLAAPLRRRQGDHRRRSKPRLYFSEALTYERGAASPFGGSRRPASPGSSRLYAWWAEMERVEPSASPSSCTCRTTPSTEGWPAHAGRGRAIRARETRPTPKQKPRRQHAASRSAHDAGSAIKRQEKGRGSPRPIWVRVHLVVDPDLYRTSPRSRAIHKPERQVSSHGSWFGQIVVPVRPMQGVPVIGEVLITARPERSSTRPGCSRPWCRTGSDTGCGCRRVSKPGRPGLTSVPLTLVLPTRRQVLG